MKKTMVALLVFIGILTGTLQAQSHTASEYETCYRLFEIMELDNYLRDAMTQMVELQIKHFDASTKAKLRPIFIEFLEKNMNIKVLGKDMADIYLKYFNENEIKELIEFYKTPVGRKFVKNQAAMFSEASSLGMKTLEKNQAELQNAMMKLLVE